MALAHGNRRVTKASSGTMSSDDLDEREMGTVYEGGESSFITFNHCSPNCLNVTYCRSGTVLLHFISISLYNLTPQKTRILCRRAMDRRAKCARPVQPWLIVWKRQRARWSSANSVKTTSWSMEWSVWRYISPIIDTALRSLSQYKNYCNRLLQSTVSSAYVSF